MEKNNNMYGIVILWDSSKKYFEHIINDISIMAVIEEMKSIQLFNEYSDFIIDIYNFNNQKELGIFKSSKMYTKYREYNLMILKISFDNKGQETYDSIKQMKKTIRDKYKNLVNDYFHDNIVHATDSIDEVEHVRKVLKKYIKNFNVQS